jgi:hypothetical protein
MPQLQVQLNKGVQAPAKLGTVILKPAAEGHLSYAQNVDISNDEYGNGVLTPGPALVTITNNSTLTGTPWVKTAYLSPSTSTGVIFIAGGTLGATDVVYRVTDVEAGQTPQIDNTNTRQITHGAHTGEVIDDIIFRTNKSTHAAHPSDKYVYVIGHDDTDGFVRGFDATDATMTLDTDFTIPGWVAGREPKMLLASDDETYVGYGNTIFMLPGAENTLTTVLDLPVYAGVTALAEWQLMAAIGYHNSDQTPTFAERKGGGKSGIIIWDFTESSFERDIPCPSRFISAIVNDPDGSLLVFGGVDEGRCTIYNFNGYGFDPLYTYIGDLPRSKHSVDFDGIGRLVFQTVDGQICRFDKRSGIFEHLSSITTGSSAGALLTRLVGGSGNEFLAVSGTGSTYTAKRMTFGNYIGDDASGSDTALTPLAISELITLSPRSMLNWTEVRLNKNLASGEKVEIRLYKDGSATPLVLGSLSFATDGAIAGKKIHLRKYGIDNMAIGVAWKQADALATAPGIVAVTLDHNQLR